MISVGIHTIQQTECYVVEDFIAPKAYEDSNIFDTYQKNDIFCSALELSRIKNKVDLPLYGIWQLLCESKVIDALDRNKKYIIYYNADKSAGQVLHFLSDNQIVTQSLLVTNVEECDEIIIDINSLLLPAEPILTLTERMQKHKTKNRNMILQVIFMLFACSGIFAFSHFYFSEILYAQVEQVKALEHENAEYQKKSLNMNQYLLSHNDYLQIMSPIILLSRMGINIKVKPMIFNKPPYQIVFSNRKYPKHVFSDNEIIKVEHQHNGQSNVYWK